MNVSEGGGDGERGGDDGESVVDLEDVFGLRVEGRVVDACKHAGLAGARGGKSLGTNQCCRLHPPLHQ